MSDERVGASQPDDEIDAALLSIADMPMDLPALGDDLEAELGALKPVKTRHPIRQFVGFLVLSLLYGVFLLSQSSEPLRHDLHDISPLLLVGFGLVWFAGFAALAWLTLVPGRKSVMPSWRAAGIGAAIAVLVYIVSNVLIADEAAHWPSSFDAYVDDGGTCLQLGLFVAAVPLLIGARLLRGSIPVGSRWAAAGLGAATGALAGLLLHVYCDMGNPVHLGLIHGGLVAVTTIVGALVIPRVSELGRR